MSDRSWGRGGRAPARVARAAPVDPSDLAWILLLPAVLVAVPAIALLAPLLAPVLLPDPDYSYWAFPGVRKATLHVAYALAVAAVLLYAGAIVLARHLRMQPATRRALVVVAQVAGAAFVIVCWIEQWGLESLGVSRTYFTPATLLVAAAATLAVALLARHGPPRLPAALQRHDERRVRWACLAAAVLATALWLLPAIHTDAVAPAGPAYLGSLFFDESSAVLNGRWPLVDMVAYATLWPYLIAGPLGALGDTYAVFTVTAATISGAALLAVYGVLRRLAGSAPLALALYLPVLATGFFLEATIGGDRYHPGTYFGMFPLRYAGPYLLALLVAWQLGRADAGRWPVRLLFAAAGLVALNNVDFGGSALAATGAALVVVRRPRDRRAVGDLAVDGVIGLLSALALVSALTLVCAGSLPHLDLLTHYGRVFVIGGVVNLPLPALGLHLALSATFVAAAAAAAVRVLRTEPGDLLAGMLTWSAVFGLGASFYYYGYRSHPDVLVNLFSIWALALALLVLALLRAPRAARRWPRPATLVTTFAFALAVCSLAQVPAPWDQVSRIVAEPRLPLPSQTVPVDGFRQEPLRRHLAERNEPGAAVLILSQVGHRVAEDAGVVNVSPYAGLEQMPAREQVARAVQILEREGGTRVYLAQREPPGLDAQLRSLGYEVSRTWRDNVWPTPLIVEYARG